MAEALPRWLADRIRGWVAELGELDRRKADLPGALADDVAAKRVDLRDAARHARFGRALSRLNFLTESTRVRRIADMPRIPPKPDLRDDLDELVGRYLDSGLDVVVVDQTTPEHRAGGFAGAKVIIPGTLPMTFGHAFRRVDGLPRLYEVPHQLGYRDRPLRPEDINRHPHPFP